MKKKKNLVLFLTLLLIMLSACSAETANTSSGSAMSDEKASVNMETEAVKEAAEEMAEDVGGTETGAIEQPMDNNRKLIRYLDYSVETKEFDKFVESLNALVEKSEGYIEYSEVTGNDYGYDGNRDANYVLRIPAKGLGSFKTEIANMGNVVRQSERVEDVTLNYVDTESHITALKAEQESLVAMLEKADTVEAVIAIQNRLTEVRYQLESYESQIRTYDNQVEYSTVTLFLREVERETKVSETFGEKLRERFNNSLYGLGDGLTSFAIWFLGGIPYWILLAVIILIIVVIVKKTGKRMRKKTAQKMSFYTENQTEKREEIKEDDNKTEEKEE